jgi:diguanylate cyclase (GGDEF)-like protein
VLSVLRFDRPFLPEELELLGALADQTAPVIHNAQLFEQVRTLSRTDPLTGLANRRQLEHDLAREFAAARRGRRLITVLFDLDYFKAYNDRYGHVAGDEVLRTFGAVLAIETRAMNLAARYGGDEFVALLSDTPREGVEIFVQRVATRFDEEMARLGRGVVTVSAGIAEFTPEMREINDLIAASDRALYSIKGDRPVAAGS